LTPEKRVPPRHPLRIVKQMAEAALKEMSPLFDSMYSAVGRSSIRPERLLKASLLMAFYTIRSERMFCEKLDYNILFRWFLDMNMDEPERAGRLTRRSVLRVESDHGSTVSDIEHLCQPRRREGRIPPTGNGPRRRASPAALRRASAIRNQSRASGGSMLSTSGAARSRCST